MIDSAIAAIEIIFSWPTILFLFMGVIIGMFFGAIPGLGGPIALSLLIPVTFGMDSNSAIILLGATLGGVAFGGSISAILINTPGTAPNAATLLDGYPMAKEGRAVEAIAIAAASSAIGAIFGLIVLVAALPFSRQIILAFGFSEFFWLAILGLTIIAVVARGDIIKGLASGLFGILLSYIGYSGLFGTYRYGFGTQYLWEGIPLIPVIIGLFAISEMISLATENKETITDPDTVQKTGQRLKGIKQVFANPKVLFSSAGIGTIIGMIPGAGGVVATFIAYMNASQISGDPDSFGEGNPQGVIASEAANDAKDGGGLLPTVVFGIPGSAVMAVLLGGFIFHGVSPGRQLLNNNMDILFVLIFTLIVSNLLTSTIGLVSAKKFSLITKIDVKVLTPVILVISLVGAYVLHQSLGDVVITVLFGIVGYFMMEYNYSRIAVIIGLILGPLVEQNFHHGLQISESGYWFFFQNPLSLLLILLTILVLAAPLIQARIH